MRNKFFCTGCMLYLLLFAVTSVFATDAWVPDKQIGNVPGEIIVGFSPKATSSARTAALEAIGGKILKQFNLPKARVTRVRLPSTDESATEAAISALKANPAVAYVSNNVYRKAFSTWAPTGPTAGVMSQSGDPLLMAQWGYYDTNVNWVSAPTNSAGVTVAVIDTGVDYNHPDLKGKVIKGYDYVNGDSDPMDDFGHGTHVAGIIAAIVNNNIGIAGMSQNAKILAIKALDSSGYGNSYDIAQAIVAAANNGSVKVINMSLGGGYDPTEYDAVDYAVNTKGKLLVAAAGNSNTSSYSGAYPAALNQSFPGKVLAVAAHGSDHCKASFSNYGTWVDITAPGVDILSTVPLSLPTTFTGTGYYEMSGTSMATPHVAGAAALAWEKYKTYTNSQISDLIINQNASTYSTRLKNDICWPNDVSGFERLNVLHILDKDFFELCTSGTKGQVYGYAFNAETGLPLSGAKVTAKTGTSTATEYVPLYGQLNFFGDQGTYKSGYGLFQALPNVGNANLNITQNQYMTFTPKDQNGLATPIPVNACFWSYAGNIPVPPKKSQYWMVITWNYGSQYPYELLLNFYDKTWKLDYTVYYYQQGDMNVPPYARLNWLNYIYYGYYINYGTEDNRAFSSSIVIKKLISGEKYIFYAYDYTGTANWDAYGMKAYLYKGGQLVKTYSPPSEAGSIWTIAALDGGKLYDINEVADSIVSPSSATATGKLAVKASVNSLLSPPKAK